MCIETSIGPHWGQIVYDEQEAALIDFARNFGTGNSQGFTLGRVIEREEHADPRAEFRRWVWSAGPNLPGLIRMRGEEAELYAYQS